MASSYSSNLKLELIGTGDQSGTWGNTTNTNLGTLLEQAIVGYTTVPITDGADTTITILDGASSTARNYVLQLTGALTANRNLIVPAIQKSYVIFNATTGGFSVTVKVSGQTGVTVANGKKAIVYNNGTDIIEVVNAAVTETGTQTLTNKTLTTPVLSGTASGTTAGRLGYAAGVFSYGDGGVQRVVANTTEAQTLTNKTLTTPVINGFTGDTSVVNIGSGQFYKSTTGAIGIGTASPTNNLTIYSNDAGATGTPLTAELYRDSASPANLDFLSRLVFTGRNAAGTKIEYGSIYASIKDATLGQGTIFLAPAVTGVNQTANGLYVDNGGAWLTAQSGSGGYLGISAISGGTGQSGQEVYTATANANGSYLALIKARGTIDTEVTVNSGDQLGILQFKGYYGAGTQALGASIQARTTEAWTSTATGTDLRFSTTSTGATGSVERFRFGPLGQLGIGGATYGTSGQALISGGASAPPSWGTISQAVTLITSGTATAVSNLDLALSTTYTSFQLVIWDPSVGYYFRTSADNGSTFAAGSQDYDYQTLTVNSTTLTGNNSEGNLIGLFGLSNPLPSIVNIYGANSSTELTTFSGLPSTGTGTVMYMGVGVRSVAQVNNFLRIIPFSGTITLKYALYGFS